MSEIIAKSHDSIQKIARQQVMYGYGIKEKGLDIENNYPYKKEDYEAIKSISVTILKKNNYKPIIENDFANKVSTVFNFKYLNKEVNFLIEYPCQLKNTAYQTDVNYTISNNNPIFIDFKNKILFESLFIPELLNYETEYPDLSVDENQIKKEKIIDNETVQIIRWKEVPYLAENRKKNIQKLIARNKYLFNDDQSYLTWLTENDEYFMENLVKVFGYTSDKKLLEWVIKKTKYNVSDPRDYGKILWTRSCDGQIKIHNETINLLKSEFSEKKSIQKNIKLYVDYLSDSEKSEKNELTAEEKNTIILAIKPLLE